MQTNYFYRIYLLLVIFVNAGATVDSNEQSNVGVKVFGPGWDNPQLIFPSRYFFVQHFSDKRVVRVEIEGKVGENVAANRKDCRIWTQVFNETNFDFDMIIVRYKLMSDRCSNGVIIKLFDANNELLMKKETSTAIYAEECVCHNLRWNELMNCDQNSEIYNQLFADLRTFNNSKFNFENSLEEMKRRYAPYTKSYSFCHYAIVNNEIYRKCYGEYVGFAQFMDDMLISLASKTRLPNTQLIVNLGDWPLSDTRRGSIAMPVFSWCGSDETFDIVLPTYEITESVLNMQGRVSLDILSIFGRQNGLPFNKKTSKLFWRGRDSNRLRLKLVDLSKKHPKLIDAALTNFFFFRDEIEKYGPSVSYTSFTDFFNYKYQINVDGTVAAYRMPMLMAGTSLLLKPVSKYYEHFYHLLRKNVHYILVDQELDELLPILRHLIRGKQYSAKKDELPASDEEQAAIVHNMRKFVLKYLLPSHIYCYYHKAIVEYSSLLKDGEIKVSKEMQLVYTAKSKKCNCNKNDANKDEL
ncbi:KDEL motif-containing protein 1-like protein [Dinothrombium tinctorium]|uniref:KDEL motif-containing protein 1-like protein n=1 Tax=Dinothrombium tinctorium TaxID=1965070 RepID=A0A3S3PK81_9ACAR|nr:KDEL motif-containing protein 1-like protein [Dinothrombium tinctorium]RWS11393.1 KDEL motif-containing protein 1-like protein [Dinothrombium tinctorium]RWS11394.1 KDEL motif-containing protein 1-like protein [Dinothrombium tinctorium]